MKPMRVRTCAMAVAPAAAILAGCASAGPGAGSRSLVADFSDLGNRMAFASHAFTGRVDAQSGKSWTDSPPRTHYKVSVANWIKDRAGSSVTISQEFDDGPGRYSLDFGERIQVGQWYLFAAKRNAGTGRYTVIAKDGYQPITENEARDMTSGPIAAALEAIRSNPEGRLTRRQTPPTPDPTLPVPNPWDPNKPTVPPSPSPTN